MINDFKNKHYRELTDEQLDSLGDKGIIEKFMSDDVGEVLKYHNRVNVMKKNFYGSLVITLLSIGLFGFFGFLCLVFPILFLLLANKFNNSLIWSVKSLKSTLYMFRHNGDFMTSIDYVFEKNLNKISHIDIGDLYK
jgi:uncharacterized membrane protein